MRCCTSAPTRPARRGTSLRSTHSGRAARPRPRAHQRGRRSDEGRSVLAGDRRSAHHAARALEGGATPGARARGRRSRWPRCWPHLGSATRSWLGCVHSPGPPISRRPFAWLRRAHARPAGQRRGARAARARRVRLLGGRGRTGARWRPTPGSTCRLRDRRRRSGVEHTFRNRARPSEPTGFCASSRSSSLRPTTGEAEAARLHKVIDEVRAGPHRVGLRSLVALRLAADPRIRLGDDAPHELRALFSGHSPAGRLGAEPGTGVEALSGPARDRARWWRAVEAMRPAAPDRRSLAGRRPQRSKRWRADWTPDSLARCPTGSQTPRCPCRAGAARLAEAKRVAKDVYAIARRRGSHAVPARLQRAAAATSGAARVVVVGERKRGKSTLIDVLLGTPDLIPRDVDVATNTYVEVLSPRSAGRPQQPSGSSTYSPVPATTSTCPRWPWASEQGNPGNARAVSHVQILLPHPLLDAGLVIVDTPASAGWRRRTARELTALERSDAIVLVLNAAAPAAPTNSTLSRRRAGAPGGCCSWSRPGQRRSTRARSSPATARRSDGATRRWQRSQSPSSPRWTRTTP